MEPEANNNFSSPAEPHEVAVVSIAISLKRIADAFTYQAQQPENLHDFLRSIKGAIEEQVNR